MIADRTAETMVTGDDDDDCDGSGVGGTQDVFLEGSGVGSGVGSGDGDPGSGEWVDRGKKGTVLNCGGAEERMRASSFL